MVFNLDKEQNDRYWYAIYNAQNRLKVHLCFDFLRKNRIEGILIKGWAAAQYYPNFERQFSDMDICVDPADFQRAKQILNSSEGRQHTVDLHKGLRHLDTVAWDDLYANSEIVEIENTPVRILRPEDHLRVLCVHWLTDGGANKVRLWDIFYAIENRRENFDWDRFLGVVSEKRRKWLLCCLGLTKLYMGLNLENTPVAGEVSEIPRWLIKSLEKEWADEVKLKPLENCLHDRKLFWRQVKKRFPPNPIQATVDMEGAFDGKPRIFYQIGDVFKRMFWSSRRLYDKIVSDE